MVENAVGLPQQISKRIDWIDFAKGIGIIMVVFGHTEIPFVYKYLIYPFHIPMFFFISGFLFSVSKYKNFASFLKNKCKSLLVPYVFFSIIWIVCECFEAILKHSFSITFVGQEIIKYIVQIRLHPIWFITCIFLIELLFYPLVKFIKKGKLPICLSIISVALVIMGVLYRKYIGVELAWNADIIFFAFPFFAVGQMFRNNNVLFEKIFNVKYAILYFAFFVIVNIINCDVLNENTYMDFYSNRYGNHLLFYLSAFGGIGFIISLSRYVKKVKIVNYIGENSLLIFALHQILFKVVLLFFNPDGLNMFLFCVVWIIYFVLSLVSCILFNEIILRTPLRVFLNKKKKICGSSNCKSSV